MEGKKQNETYRLVNEETGIMATYDIADTEMLPAVMAYFGRLILAVNSAKRLRMAEALINFVSYILTAISTAWIINSYILPVIIEQMGEAEVAELTEMDRYIAVVVFTAFVTICLWVGNTVFELAANNILYGDDGNTLNKNERLVIGAAELGVFFVLSWVIMQANYLFAFPILIMAMFGLFRLTSIERKKWKSMMEVDHITETMTDREKMKNITDIIKTSGKYYDSDLGYELTEGQGWAVNSIVNSDGQ